MNGYSETPQNYEDETTESASAILHALELIHSPKSNNDIRREATEFLDRQKDVDGAYRPGYYLAADHGRIAIVRHFGLSLIEHTIRLKWHDLADVQAAQVRSWTLDLARKITETDPPYIRNKVAQLWVELAKKSWAVDWLDMDQALLTLWNTDLTRKDLVLTILENLSEDTFAREDSAAAIRGQELNTALVEIFTPAAQFAGGLMVGKTSVKLRANDEGWLARIVHFMQECISNASTVQARLCLTRALATLRSVFSWIMLSAVVSTHALRAICASFSVEDTDILMVSTSIALIHCNVDCPNLTGSRRLRCKSSILSTIALISMMSNTQASLCRCMRQRMFHYCATCMNGRLSAWRTCILQSTLFPKSFLRYASPACQYRFVSVAQRSMASAFACVVNCLTSNSA